MAGATQPKNWPILRSLGGMKKADLAGDIAAGLTLAAIAVPEQMATAKLGAFPAEIGLFAFVAGTLGFALFGANRYLSTGADSTITPIFAGALGVLAAQGSTSYAGLAAALALAVGIVMVLCGLARLGWIANFLSVPVTTGLLAGIAVHIVVSQLPALLGLGVPDGTLFARCAWIATHLSATNVPALVLGALVLAISIAGERLKWSVPGPLLGLALAMIIVWAAQWNVAVVGTASGAWSGLHLPEIDLAHLENVASLTLVIATVVMVQTAATTRAFTSIADPQDINRDFIGVGTGNIVAGAFGLFPVNASPPRTAAVEQAGGRTQLSGLCAAFVVVLLLAFGGRLLGIVPLSALAGVLFAVALRIARVSTFLRVFRESPWEFALIVATMAAIVVLPIQTGAAVGIGLSLLHGIWTITRTRVVLFEKVPGSSVWWPPQATHRGEKLPDIRVAGFPAPLSFLNADEFRRDMIEIIERDRPRLLVFEASSVAEIDYTAGQVLLEIITRCREAGIIFVIARLTSQRADDALARFGVKDKLGARGIFRSVDEAIRAFAP